MLGNGFDVSFGIKSSYSDFYKWYCPQSSDVSHIDTFRKNIDEEIKSNKPNEEKVWADFEVGIGQYTTKFTKETVDDFIDCFIDAQTNIREYLTEQMEKFDLDKFSKDDYSNFSKSLCNFYDEITDADKDIMNNLIKNYPNENRRLSFITFNYTDTLERILAKIPDAPLHTWKYNSSTYSYLFNRDVIHVHGTTEVAPILGVNDDSQIANKELLKTSQFRDFLIKAESVKALGHLWQQHAETLISNSSFICVLGMSLGPTDAKWWRKLCQWLKSSSRRRLVLYWFEKNPPGKIAYVKELQCKNKVKEKFLSYSNLTDSEKETIKNQIYVVINTEKFMQLPTPQELNQEDSGEKKASLGEQDNLIA